MRLEAPSTPRPLSHSSFDDAAPERDAAWRDFLTDLAIVGGEAVLSVMCFRIAATDGNVTFLMIGLVAAFTAALPLRDWLSGVDHPMVGRFLNGWPIVRNFRASPNCGSNSSFWPGPASLAASRDDASGPLRLAGGRLRIAGARYRSIP